MGRKERLWPSSPLPEKSVRGDSAAAPPQWCRRQPVILRNPVTPSARFAEFAGGKTAECAAICCCFPFGIANLIVLAVVKLPAGLFRQALRKRILVRRGKKKAKLLGSGSSSDSGGSSGSSKRGSSSEGEIDEVSEMSGSVFMVFGDMWPERSPSAEVIELEKEMWSKFYGSGFWRSPSQNDGGL
ncbi:hypothetical protein AXF42_Ash018358 [Apostasia shenzhenica]|uniref:Uncharacterized protein n=1 Tax=Apostasia shenzhenica TaxID=1088818 RepID=A0A2H9ZR94_9ASPA|nr:hypothetical protein AXF42_Ash018358 [Apostasia shenzhenica]